MKREGRAWCSEERKGVAVRRGRKGIFGEVDDFGQLREGY